MKFLLMLFLSKNTKHPSLYGDVGIFSHFAVEVFVVFSVRNRLGLHPESRPRRRFDLFCKNLLEISIRSEIEIEVSANCFVDICQNTVSN